MARQRLFCAFPRRRVKRELFDLGESLFMVNSKETKTPIMKRLFFAPLMLTIGSVAFGQTCVNADFENGTLDYWEGGYGFPGNPSSIMGFNQDADNSLSGNHTLMTSGYDPRVGGTLIPRVYDEGSISLRLGNESPNYGSEVISKTFLVNSNTSGVQYHFASVVEATGHAPADQPFFRVKAFDENNAIIPFGSFEVSESALPTLTGFVNSSGLIYNTWQTHLLPLGDYVGQEVRIEFVTADCGLIGHFGYAYVDAECVDMQIEQSSPYLCSQDTMTLSAPKGAASYSWAGPGILTPSNERTIDINGPGTYTVSMTTFGSSPTTFSLTVELDEFTSPTAFYELYSSSMPAQYIIENHATGTSALDYIWDWGDTHQDVAMFPSHVYSQPATYTICLSVIDTVGCDDNYCQEYTFDELAPWVVVVDPLTVGINETDFTFSIYPNPGTTNLTIESHTPLAQVWVRDVAGRAIMNETLRSAQSDKKTLDVSSLPSGIYLVEVLTQNGQHSVQKVVVE
jgi:hypothetical protein